jgi:hypothetical protein
MKIFIRYSAIVFLLTTALFGCGKNFLDKNPTDQFPAQNFWKTAGDADIALTAIYDYLIQGYNYTNANNTGQGWGAGTPYWETLTDNAYSSAFSNVATGAIEPTTGSIQSDAYNTSYKAIQACNIFLANIGNVPIPQANITRYTAEVRFMRAYYYFLLAQLYGDVVYYSRPIGNATEDPEAYQLGRLPKSQVIDSVINDLNFAVSNLPDIAYSGHVVKVLHWAILPKYI